MFKTHDKIQLVFFLKKKNSKANIFLMRLKVQQPKPGHLEEDYPNTTFFENKRFSSFFCKQKIKCKVQLCTHWKL